MRKVAGERLVGASHCQKRGVMDVNVVDFFRPCPADTDGTSSRHEGVKGSLSGPEGHGLGVFE